VVPWAANVNTTSTFTLCTHVRQKEVCPYTPSDNAEHLIMCISIYLDFVPKDSSIDGPTRTGLPFGLHPVES
jgi:hypothetical protein